MAEDNKLGRKITTLREAHHLTCQDLADRCGCDVTVIEKLEAGEVPPSLAPLIKLTRALGGGDRDRVRQRDLRARPRRVHLLRFHRAPPGKSAQWTKC